MSSVAIDHPVVAVLAFLSALPFGWPVIRAFAKSARDDIDQAMQWPILSYIGWFPEWTAIKFFWLVVVLTALSITFYKLYTLAGAFFGLAP